MSKLTITVDETVLRRARRRALSEGSSLDTVLGKFLESYAAVKGQLSALGDLLALSRKSRSRSETAKRWTRDELHERR